MATFIVTDKATNKSKTVELNFIETKFQVKTIECLTALDQGSDNLLLVNSGLISTMTSGFQDGLVYNKTYKFEVTEFIGGCIPTEEQKKKICWIYSYKDDSGTQICSNPQKSGSIFALEVTDIEMCGREIQVYAYFEDEQNEGRFDVFCHYRFRWFSRKNIESEAITRANSPSTIDQNVTPLCGIVCILYAMIKIDPDGYKKFALDLHRKGEASYNNYLIKPEEHFYEMTPTSIDDYPYKINKAKTYIERMPQIDWITMASIRNNENRMYNGKSREQFDGINWPPLMKRLCKEFLGATFIEKKYKPRRIFNKKEYKIITDINNLFNRGHQVMMLISAGLVEKNLKIPPINSTHGETQGIVGLPNHWVPYTGCDPYRSLDHTLSGTVNFKVATWGKEEIVSIKYNHFNRGFYGYIAIK